MRISSNQYQAVMQFALSELKEIYPTDEIKAMMYILFDEYLNVKKDQYFLNLQKGMSESELLKFNFAIKDLKKNKPLQHILGYSWFLDHKIWVNEHSLIPRPETEQLVQVIIEREQLNTLPLRILDMCTGTACIAIALDKALPNSQIVAADFKDEILKLATRNAKLNNSHVKLVNFDLLKDSAEIPGIFDVIVSNPPYVLESEKKQMHQNVLKYEPASALYVDDEDPLLFYHKIIELAKRSLKENGRLYFEINEGKGDELKEILENNSFHSVEILKDFRNKNRFIIAQRSSE